MNGREFWRGAMFGMATAVLIVALVNAARADVEAMFDPSNHVAAIGNDELRGLENDPEVETDKAHACKLVFNRMIDAILNEKAG